MRVIPTTVLTRGRPNPTYLMMPVRLKRELKLRHMSPAQLSMVMKAGPNTVAQIVAGKRIPRLRMLERLADALHVSPAWLAFGLTGAWEPAEQQRCEGLAARIRQLREKQGLSLREFGRRADSSAAALRQLEGGSQPTLDTLEALAKALRVSPSWLAYGIGDREVPRRSRPPVAASPDSGALR